MAALHCHRAFARWSLPTVWEPPVTWPSRENGDVYVAIRGNNPGGIVALHDTNGDGRFEQKEHFGEGSATGIALRHGYLYVAHPTKIERFKMIAGQLVPSGAAETIVQGLPPETPTCRQGNCIRR